MGPAGFPDGIAFDSYGNLWGTITGGERIFSITPEGDLRIIFDDRNEDACRKIDEAFFSGNLTQETIFSGLSSVAPATASVTFGGKNLDTVYIGSLFEKRIPYFSSPVRGEPPPGGDPAPLSWIYLDANGGYRGERLCQRCPGCD